MLHTHLPLIISAIYGTQYFAAVAVLYTHNVHNLHDLNSLDACAFRTMREQESVVVRQEITNYMQAIAHMLYSM